MLIIVDNKCFDSFDEVDTWIKAQESVVELNVEIYVNSKFLKTYHILGGSRIKSQVYKIQDKDNYDRLVLLLNNRGDNKYGTIYKFKNQVVFSSSDTKDIDINKYKKMEGVLVDTSVVEIAYLLNGDK